MSEKRGNWGSTMGFVLAAVGSAVGMGNLWGFPYKMGANGGLPFLLIYLFMVVTCGVVVMCVEMTIGRNTGKSPMLALTSLSKKYTLVGIFGVLCSFLIMGFYAVLIGYSVRYAGGYLLAIFGGNGFGGMDGGAFFGAFTGNIGAVLGFTVLTFAVCWVIVAAGVQGGIEKFNKIGIPALFIMLLGIIIYNCTLPGNGEGWAFMFTSKGMEMADTSFNFFKAVRAAAGQMLFSLSLGMGCLITYGSYLKENTNISATAWLIPAADTLAALMAGMAIFPAVFAMGGSPAAGPGLLFITMFNTFDSMGAAGNVVGLFFYVLVILAGVSSAISLMEVATSNFIDVAVSKGKNPDRKKWSVAVTLIMIVLAVPVCIDMLGGQGWGVYQFLADGSKDLLDLYDFLAEGVMMPLGALLMCVFVGWGMKHQWMKNEIEKGGNKFYSEGFFKVCVKYITPIVMAFVFVSLAASYLGF